MADAAEVGDATDPMDDLHLSSKESSRFRGLALHHMSQTGQVLLQAAEDDAVWSAASEEERAPPSPDRTPAEGDEPPDKSFTEAHEQGLSYGAAAAEIANDNMARHIAAHINALEASTTREQLPRPHRC